MKKFLTIAVISGALFTGCKSTGGLSGTDDVYANPAEERRLAQIAREEQAKKEALERQAAAAQEQVNVAEENNPYYKDPEYNSDDYYDYEYASRINRFHRPLPGAGFYDPYYTNMYTYNQNPAFWGTSIYSGGWGMPSQQFGMYSMGISSGWGYSPGISMGMSYGMGYRPGCGMGYYGMYNPYYYDPFCFNTGFYDPWGWSSFNRGYSMGYYNGFYNGMYGGGYYGYYNRVDPNSAYSKVHYGPRGSSGGGSNTDPRRTVTSESGLRRQYIESVAQEQDQSPRFSDRRSTSRRIYNEGNPNRPVQEQNRTIQQGSQPNSQPGQSPRTGRRSQSRRIYQGAPRQQAPQQQQRQQNSNRNNNSTWSPAPSNSGSSGGGRSGGSSPRGGGGGGNSSPRR